MYLLTEQKQLELSQGGISLFKDFNACDYMDKNFSNWRTKTPNTLEIAMNAFGNAACNSLKRSNTVGCAVLSNSLGEKAREKSEKLIAEFCPVKIEE